MPRQDKNWGNLRLKKGGFVTEHKNLAEQTITMYAWDASDNEYCPDCKIYMSCPYADGRGHYLAKISDDLAPKCYFQVDYLSKAMHAAYSAAGGTVTQDQVWRIGMELIPLYAQLFKFKLYEYYMKTHNQEGLIVVSEKGMKKIHPVYKEIREVIKTLSILWKDITGGQSAKKLPMEGDKEFANKLSTVNMDNADGKKWGRADQRLKAEQEKYKENDSNDKGNSKTKGGGSEKTKKKRRRRT